MKIASFFEVSVDELVYGDHKDIELTGSIGNQFFEIHHQLKSIGETLKTLDYDLADGVHLPGFGISLCQIAEKMESLDKT